MRTDDSIRLCPVHGGKYKGHCYRTNISYSYYFPPDPVDCCLMEWGFWRFGRREFIARVTVALMFVMAGIALVCLGTVDPAGLHAIHYGLGCSGWVMLSVASIIPLPLTLTVKSLTVGTASALTGAFALLAAGFWVVAVVLLALAPVLCVPMVLNHVIAPESIRQAAIDEIADDILKRSLPETLDGLSLRAMRDETVGNKS